MRVVALATLAGLLSGFVFPILKNQQLRPASEHASKKRRPKKIIQTSFFAMRVVAFATLSELLSGFVFPILKNQQLRPASEHASKKRRPKKIIQTSFFAMRVVAFTTLSELLSGFVFPILNNERVWLETKFKVGLNLDLTLLHGLETPSHPNKLGSKWNHLLNTRSMYMEFEFGLNLDSLNVN